MRPAIKTKALISSSDRKVQVMHFGEVNYRESLSAMQSNAESTSNERQDQIWMLQHPPIYTQGTACEQQPFVPSSIELVKTDRGGQITYHGPGQLVVYPLLDLKRFTVDGKHLGVKNLVKALQLSIQEVLQDFGIESELQDDAPGVYVKQKKIASVGLRIKRGVSYHGISLNIDMDLSPFTNIDPCGYAGLQVTSIAQELASDGADIDLSVELVGWKFTHYFLNHI